jgi:hypothetical protein
MPKIKKYFCSRMESSELVQRMQAQVLQLREENCEFKEKEKYCRKKLIIFEKEKDELENKLKIETRKNKAMSFLPGQSGK